MAKLLVVIAHEFQVMVSRWTYRIFASIVPVLAVLVLIGVAVYQGVRTEAPPPAEIRAGYVDMTSGPDGDPIFTDHRQQGRTEFVPYPDADSATDALLAGDIQQLFIIPPEYVDTGLVREVRRASGGLPSPQIVGQASSTPLGRFLLSNLFDAVGDDRADRLFAPFHLAPIEIDETGQPVTDGPDLSNLGFFLVVGFLLIMAVFMTAGYLLQGLNEEKENRIMEVLLSSLRPEQLLFGKLFGLGAAGLLQMLVWVTTGVLFVLALGAIVDLPEGLVQVPPAGAVLLAMVYFVLGYFFFGTLMAALGAVTTTQKESNQVTALIVLPGIAPLWFLQVLLENPEGTVARVLSFIPFTAPIVGMTRLGLDSMDWLDAVLSIGLLAASVGIAMLLTARLFRAFLLSYGQRPSLRQVFRTLKGA